MADSHGEHHSHPPYKFIFGLLCLFTGLSWLADEAQGLFPNMGFLATFVLIVATAKALCVLLSLLVVEGAEESSSILIFLDHFERL